VAFILQRAKHFKADYNMNVVDLMYHIDGISYKSYNNYRKSGAPLP
jgi:hypothetical protein